MTKIIDKPLIKKGEGKYIEISPTSKFRRLSIFAYNPFTININDFIKQDKDLVLEFDNVVNAYTTLKFFYTTESNGLKICNFDTNPYHKLSNKEIYELTFIDKNPYRNLRRSLDYFEVNNFNKQEILEKLLYIAITKGKYKNLCCALLSIAKIEGYNFIDFYKTTVFSEIDFTEIYNKIYTKIEKTSPCEFKA